MLVKSKEGSNSGCFNPDEKLHRDYNPASIDDTLQQYFMNKAG
jgi:hypothetical protein